MSTSATRNGEHVASAGEAAGEAAHTSDRPCIQLPLRETATARRPYPTKVGALLCHQPRLLKAIRHPPSQASLTTQQNCKRSHPQSGRCPG